MILQALTQYYDRKQLSPDPKDRLPAYGLEEKEIPFVIEIDKSGNFVTLVDTRVIEGKKKIAQKFLIPQGVKKTSGIATNLLWDNAEYVLGIVCKGKLDRVAEQHKAFREKISSLPIDTSNDLGIVAVKEFFEKLDLSNLELHPSWNEIIDTNPNFTFRLHGDVELICQRPAIIAATAQSSEVEDANGICLVSGTPAEIERLHSSIKGVWGAQTAGANIVSFNLPAFSSFGKDQGANSPVGKAAVFAYTTALNSLLGRGSRQRAQVGDTSTVFWAAQEHELENSFMDLFGEPSKDDPDRSTNAIKMVMQAAQTGRFSRGGAETEFYVLGLSPNAARIAIRFWEKVTAFDVSKRVAQHFTDLEIVRAPHDPEYLSLFRLLTALAIQGKADNIPPNLGGEVMRSILNGTPYPAGFLNLAIQRSKAEQHPSYARIAVIKASINRIIRRNNLNSSQKEKEFHVMLDTTNHNPAYLLGRLFATLEKIQEEANPGINATIRDRYYSAASSTPVAVFTTLLRLKNHHLGKLHKGRAVQLEKLIAEIMSDLSDFPRILTLQEQGRFALGYYHQRQTFFTKPQSSTEEVTQ
ncbi:type I-C CRISPR-associated protein Cas8c/Csd1 [Undibacterium flavidum]|uniref:Type I-C CRISPR-associated protein Cas8c/Csd1 n=1 Tax=Undibacterium flavidum TaxID=2762297 RepID=A0ABR6YH25_9BURK|nr:type I-C CRISPR-associated protein Cas8c/Csd1 [Undibacterium flavidum]MBC3875847.1 type I-C CRISPR-associated protein Cas8c/Csd1 [Undibacterium flavidum]